VPPNDEYNPPADFYDTHSCIDTFWDGSGYATMCNDYLWSLAGRIQGRCSGHGGDSGYPLY
jgi:uncharacterized protein with PIN domain